MPAKKPDRHTRQARQGSKPSPHKIQNEMFSKTYMKTIPKPSIWNHLGHNRGEEYFSDLFWIRVATLIDLREVPETNQGSDPDAGIGANG